MLALLTGDRGSGTLGGSGGGQHQHLQRPQPYLVDHGALLVLPRSLLRLDMNLDLVGCTGAVFCPGPSGCSWVLISKSDQTLCQT